jgi:hypothetical protein
MERIYGCNFDCQLVKKIDWHLSFSGLELDQNNKPKPYCNTGVSVKLKSLTVEARSGININEPEIIPLFFDCLYSSDVNKFRFSMKFLPERLYAPRSRALYRLYDISEPVNSTLTEFKLLADNFFIQWLTLSSSISLLLDESLQKSFDATFMIKGIVDQLTYKLAYSWLPSGSAFDSSTIILRGSINHRLHRYFNVDSDWRVSIINHDHSRYNLQITPKIIFPHSIELEPFVAFSGGSDKRPRVSGGVKQVFTLLKHISTEFTCIFPLCEGTVRGKVDVNAKMWFLF